MKLSPRHFTPVVCGVLAIAASVTTWVLACGWGPEDLVTVQTIFPAHLEDYGRGTLGVVRPHFARRFLVQAYRLYSGATPLPATVRNEPNYYQPWEQPPAGYVHPEEEYRKLRSVAFYGIDPPGQQTLFARQRQVSNYQWIDNCLDDAFATATSTLKARAGKYGNKSREVQEWLHAQDAVFANCGGGPLVLPKPPSEPADALSRADRAYQTAAAYFYALEYDEAARRFRAIAADASSPWRPYGRFLAARALIRSATIKENVDAAKLFAEAEAELKGIVADPALEALHASAHRLLDFVAVRVRPLQQLATLSASLARDRQLPDQRLIDYQILMDRMVGNTTAFDYASIERRSALIDSGDLTDWIVAMQGSGDEALARALQQWRTTRSTPWLVAALWKIPAQHRDAPAVLTAAQQIDESSPAFPTVAFLRVRLLAARGETEAARRLLATLPAKPGRGFPVETINLLAAERFMLARTLEELLANAPRTIVNDGNSTAAGAIGFDEDAGRVFTERLPLARLIDASLSNTLPDRLRARVAAAAFTRALLLQRYDDSRRLLPVLEQLAPSLRADLQRYATAPTPEDRQIAIAWLLLRTPGLTPSVRGLDDDDTFGQIEPARALNHQLPRNWWCELTERHRIPAGLPPAEIAALVHGGAEIPSPSFLTAAELGAARNEFAALMALPPAPNYLAAEAVKWARARPKDGDAAEALALAVLGTRWGCGDANTGEQSRRAFQTLHQLFPKTESARRTKYWYSGR